MAKCLFTDTGLDNMIERNDIQPLLQRHKLMNIEVDERHLRLINDVYELGVNVGINKAKESVLWRVNGAMWAGFIDEAIQSSDFDSVLGKDQATACL